MNEIQITTFSNNGVWKCPTVEINSKMFIYASHDNYFHGLQHDGLNEVEPQIMKLCDEISGKVRDLFNLINKEKV